MTLFLIKVLRTRCSRGPAVTYFLYEPATPALNGSC